MTRELVSFSVNDSQNPALYTTAHTAELLLLMYLCGMIKQLVQHPEVLKEADRLAHFFETNPILIREWKEGCMLVKDIPYFISLELHAARTFNPAHYFNPPLRRLQQLEKAVLNQTGAPAAVVE